MVQVVRHKELNLTNLYVICLQFDLFTVSIFDALFILRVRFKVEMLAVKPRLVIFFIGGGEVSVMMDNSNCLGRVTHCHTTFILLKTRSSQLARKTLVFHLYLLFVSQAVRS